jgi:hypothetical protein
MTNRIPHRLHFILLTKEVQTAARSLAEKELELPAWLRPYYDRAKELHPDWEMNIYDEYDARRILEDHFPALLPIYQSYAHLVQKADVLRVALIYLYGGFYLDLDMLCLKNLEELCGCKVVLAKEKIITEDKAFYLGVRHTLRVASYMFGGIPGHPFWLSVLKEAVKMARKEVVYEYDVAMTTGPDLLTNVYHAGRHIYADVTLLDNIDRKCTVDWHEAISCYFGNFATHLHKGLWRWDGKKSTVVRAYRLSEEDQRKAVAEMDRLLQKTPVPTGEDVVLLSADKSMLDAAPGLRQPYKRASTGLRIVKDTKRLSGRKILAFGDPPAYRERISPSNINILYTLGAWVGDEQKEQMVACLNECYDYCVVPHDRVRTSLIKAGAGLPVTTVELGFHRPRRELVLEDDDQESDVTIACFCTDNACLERVIHACERIRNGRIPRLRLRLVGQPDRRRYDTLFREKLSGRQWIDILEMNKVLATGTEGVHCYLFPDTCRQWLLGPREALYEGIPVLLTGDSIFRTLADEGFVSLLEEDLEQGIMEMFSNYAYYNERAIMGSAWIEDKWTIESTFLELLRYCSSHVMLQTYG